MNNYKKLSMIMCSLGLMLLLTGTIYAYFNYTRTGTNNALITGDIYLTLNEGEDEISLTNVFPETKEEARARDDNFITFTINGINESNRTIYYEIDLVYGDNVSNKTRFNDSDLMFDLIEVGDNNTETYVVNAGNYDDLTNKRIWVDTIEGHTSSEVARTYKLRMWLGDKVLISDSDPNESYPATGVNAYKDHYATIRVKVLGNFEEKSIPKTLYQIMQKDAVIDNIQSEFVSASTGIDFGSVSSDTNGKGVYTRAGTENDTYPIMYYRGEVEDNNVMFAGQCWKAVRTTDTGGVKLIYNGENAGTIDEPNCNNTGTDTHISLSGKNMFAFNSAANCQAYNGYMYGYGMIYASSTSSWANGARFGSSFTWDGTYYTLVDDSLTSPNATHHYSCNVTTEGGTCTQLRYVYYVRESTKYYIKLSGGEGIEEALVNMQTNTNDSNAKNKIDTWYSSNMTSVTNKLEDTIWCNDRSVGDGNNNGWIANGGDLNTNLYYGARERSNYADNTSTVKNQPSLACVNKNDAFTVSNGNGNQKLTYPVALLTEDEMVLAGGIAGSSSTFYLNNGSKYWSLSPHNSGIGFYLDNGSINYGNVSTSFRGLRPSISLKPGTPVVSGDGTANDPYVIE